MEIYTIDEIRAKIASHDYSAELMLKHAMEVIGSLEVELSAFRSARGLPDLPEPDRVMWQYGRKIEHYTADQVRAYAAESVAKLSADNDALRASLRDCVDYMDEEEMRHIASFGEDRLASRLKMLREDAQRARELLGRAQRNCNGDES